MGSRSKSEKVKRKREKVDRKMVGIGAVCGRICLLFDTILSFKSNTRPDPTN